SNPSSSAIFQCPLRTTASSPGLHSGDWGSIPQEGANFFHTIKFPAVWQNGNALSCNLSIRRFDSDSRLQFKAHWCNGNTSACLAEVTGSIPVWVATFAHL